MAFITSIILSVVFAGLPDTSAINVSEAVAIGGIKQWISIKGADRSNPLLLFLHGGPGNSVMGYSDKFTNHLQEHFVVVQWDQRGSGTTAKLNKSSAPLSVSRMENDAVEVINYLRQRFSKEKVLLMGHSWGGFLGLLIASKHPELLSGYVAISPMVNQVQSERLSLQWMIERATAEGKRDAVEQLKSVVIPFATAQDLYYHRSWLAKLSGRKSPNARFVYDWAKEWLPLFREASAINFFETAPAINCPIYFMVGKLDYQTHFQITRDYYEILEAPRKEWFWFEDTGHSIPSQSPEKLQELVLQQILPHIKE